MRRLLCIILLSVSVSLWAESGDTLSRWGGALSFTPAAVVPTDEFVSKWLKGRQTQSVTLELHRATLPQDSDLFARQFGYPVLSAHLRYTHSDVTMHRENDPAWGQAVPVDYLSHLGDVLSVYGQFYRPLFRSRRWDGGYQLSMGFAYAGRNYSRTDNIDDELIGSHANIFFGVGALVSWHFSSQWALRGGVEFFHHSNGALYRPNKGANYLGPSLALVYSPYYFYSVPSRARSVSFHNSRLYFEPSLSMGAKTLNEDWQHTQFQTAPGEPHYRTETFKIYPVYAFSLLLMSRYALRYASGVSADYAMEPTHRTWRTWIANRDIQ